MSSLSQIVSKVMLEKMNFISKPTQIVNDKILLKPAFLNISLDSVQHFLAKKVPLQSFAAGLGTAAFEVPNVFYYVLTHVCT